MANDTQEKRLYYSIKFLNDEYGHPLIVAPDELSKAGKIIESYTNFSEFQLTKVWMTPEERAALPEFAGF